MLSVKISVLVVLGVITTCACQNSGFVCTANFCDTVDCFRIIQNGCDGIWIPNASPCGCCVACKGYLEVGSACSLKPLIPPDAIITLNPLYIDIRKVTARCRPPSSCINGYCSRL